MNYIKQCPNVRSSRWKRYLVLLGISGINIFLLSSWTNSGTQRINNIGHRKLASERLVPRHGPLNQISNRIPSCLVLIKWLLALEKVVVSYQRNDTTQFCIRKYVFTGVTYRVWVTQRQLHSEKSLSSWAMTHIRGIPGSSPIIPRQLCAFLLLALHTAVSSRTRSLCSLHIAVDPKASFLYSESCVHPSSFQEALFQ